MCIFEHVKSSQMVKFQLANIWGNLQMVILDLLRKIILNYLKNGWGSEGRISELRNDQKIK
jgi:hypothetical protein